MAKQAGSKGGSPSPWASPEPPDSSSNPDLPHHSYQRVQKTILLSKDRKSFADQKLLRGRIPALPSKASPVPGISISDGNISLPPRTEPCTEPCPCARAAGSRTCEITLDLPTVLQSGKHSHLADATLPLKGESPHPNPGLHDSRFPFYLTGGINAHELGHRRVTKDSAHSLQHEG